MKIERISKLSDLAETSPDLFEKINEIIDVVNAQDRSIDAIQRKLRKSDQVAVKADKRWAERRRAQT